MAFNIVLDRGLHIGEMSDLVTREVDHWHQQFKAQLGMHLRTMGYRGEDDDVITSYSRKIIMDHKATLMRLPDMRLIISDPTAGALALIQRGSRNV